MFCQHIKRNELNKKIIAANLLEEQKNILEDLLNRNKEDNDRVKEEDKIKFPFIIIEFPENKSTNNNVSKPN